MNHRAADMKMHNASPASSSAIAGAVRLSLDAERIDRDRAARLPHRRIAEQYRNASDRSTRVQDEITAPRCVLSPASFGACVRHEKRRCERNGGPLSMAIYETDGDRLADSALSGSDHLLQALLALTRETDFLGRLGDGSLAVLCPDTDAAGLAAMIRKVELRTGGQTGKPTAATYPHRLFALIEQGASVPAERADPFDSDRVPRARRGYVGKRALDVMLALGLLLLFGPLMLLVAAAIAVESRGPIVFRQMRLGLGGAPFVFYKFRSMWSGVDDDAHRAFVLRLIKQGDPIERPEAAQRNPYKLKADSRVTRVGRFIRKTSIDELPQLFNVLMGDMSLVGPRPPISYEAASYEPWHLRRLLDVKPGITGLWQVEGRSRVTFNDMVRMDLRYVRDCSLWLDLKILLKTVRVVLYCDGAQ